MTQNQGSGRSHDTSVTDWEKESESNKHDSKKSTIMSSYMTFMKLGISLEVIGYLVNKTMRTGTRKIENIYNWCVNFKSGKFWESLSPYIGSLNFGIE